MVCSPSGRQAAPVNDIPIRLDSRSNGRKEVGAINLHITRFNQCYHTTARLEHSSAILLYGVLYLQSKSLTIYKKLVWDREMGREGFLSSYCRHAVSSTRRFQWSILRILFVLMRVMRYRRSTATRTCSVMSWGLMGERCRAIHPPIGRTPAKFRSAVRKRTRSD